MWELEVECLITIHQRQSAYENVKCYNDAYRGSDSVIRAAEVAQKLLKITCTGEENRRNIRKLRS